MTENKNKVDSSNMFIAKWAVSLSIFWLLLSGYIQPLMLSFGAISVVIVLIVLKRMEGVAEKPLQFGTGVRMIRYFPWLVVQIIRSSVQVTKLIWGSPKKISPALAKINVENVPPSSRVLYANSITLTPGTLSVDLIDGEINVHALQKSSIDELEDGYMEQKITGIWGENK